MNPQGCPIPRLEKLLLSTDGTEFSEGAVREAISLAKQCASRLYVVSVIETNPEYETLAPQLVEKAEVETKAYHESINERASKEGVECEFVVHEGEDSYRYIVDEAEKRHVEMIIMGRGGRTGFKRLMMGSVTAKVIGHAPCNVLVVPRAARIELKKILVATDGSRYGDSASKEALGIAKRCGATLTALSVVHSESMSHFDIVHSQIQRELIAEKEHKVAECSINAVKALGDQESIGVEGLIKEGIPYKAIIDTATQKKVDLIVVGTYGRTGLEKLLMGSVTERVIILSPCAVLVVRTK